MYEPTELDEAIMCRVMMNVVAFGPLTKAEHEGIEAYERYHEEAEVEYDAQQAAGGRTICPQCNQRSVKHRSVLTYGHAAHPEAEYSDFAECENCDYKEL